MDREDKPQHLRMPLIWQSGFVDRFNNLSNFNKKKHKTGEKKINQTISRISHVTFSYGLERFQYKIRKPSHQCFSPLEVSPTSTVSPCSDSLSLYANKLWSILTQNTLSDVLLGYAGNRISLLHKFSTNSLLPFPSFLFLFFIRGDFVHYDSRPHFLLGSLPSSKIARRNTKLPAWFNCSSKLLST